MADLLPICTFSLLPVEMKADLLLLCILKLCPSGMKATASRVDCKKTNFIITQWSDIASTCHNQIDSMCRDLLFKEVCFRLTSTI